jgi:uncharacterized protein
VQLDNEFRVGVPAQVAWKVLTDIERIAPMVPGAQLEGVEGDDQYTGSVRVKVGAIAATYRGSVTVTERDESAGLIVLKAKGRDTRGQGNAEAVVTAVVAQDGDVTLVTVNTDLTISGKVAQFGRGILADVSSGLIGRFVQTLETSLASERGSAD